MGAGNKDEGRRKVGPADPATRARLINEAIAGGGGRPAPKTIPRGSSSAVGESNIKASDLARGADALTGGRKRAIEKALEDAGA